MDQTDDLNALVYLAPMESEKPTPADIGNAVLARYRIPDHVEGLTRGSARVMQLVTELRPDFVGKALNMLSFQMVSSGTGQPITARQVFHAAMQIANDELPQPETFTDFQAEYVLRMAPSNELKH